MNKALNFKYNFSVECSFAIKIIPQYGVISNLYLIPFIFWLPHPTLHRALYSTFHLIIFFGREQKVTFRVCVHLSNWHYALKSEFLYTRLHQIVLKKNLLDLQQCKFERSPQSKLDRGCNEAKSVNFKSRAQTPLKEVQTFSTQSVRKFLPLPLVQCNQIRTYYDRIWRLVGWQRKYQKFTESKKDEAVHGPGGHSIICVIHSTFAQDTQHCINPRYCVD